MKRLIFKNPWWQAEVGLPGHKFYYIKGQSSTLDNLYVNLTSDLILIHFKINN